MMVSKCRFVAADVSGSVGMNRRLKRRRIVAGPRRSFEDFRPDSFGLVFAEFL
jgi:hypothetical protein